MGVNSKEYAAKYYIENRARYQEHARKRKAVNLELVSVYRALPCSDCHKHFPPCCMEFDHVLGRGNDPHRCISSMVYGRGLAALEAEIKNCEIVCANCHAIRTYERGQNRRGGRGDGSGYSGNRITRQQRAKRGRKS